MTLQAWILCRLEQNPRKTSQSSWMKPLFEGGLLSKKHGSKPTLYSETE